MGADRPAAPTSARGPPHSRKKVPPRPWDDGGRLSSLGGCRRPGRSPIGKGKFSSPTPQRGKRGEAGRRRPLPATPVGGGGSALRPGVRERYGREVFLRRPLDLPPCAGLSRRCGGPGTAAVQFRSAHAGAIFSDRRQAGEQQVPPEPDPRTHVEIPGAGVIAGSPSGLRPDQKVHRPSKRE